MGRTLATAAASAVVCVASLLAACGSSDTPRAADGGGSSGAEYDATITRTTLGIPHIEADDFTGIGYGYGYAFAEDNLCVLQEDLVTIRGERARYFGRDGSYTIEPNGTTADNVTSDYFWKFMATDAAIQPTRDNTLPDYKDVVRGFVAGYNRYIRELRAGQHPGRHAACADADWLFEIEDDDLYRRFYRLALIASSSVFINEVVAATPPSLLPQAGKSGGQQTEPSAARKAELLTEHPGPFGYFTAERKFGSNMYALSKDATTDGRSIVFGNPHFPWIGTERLYISHMKIPGRLDIMGSSLYGVPAILIGFNDHVAWSHTVSTAYRFTMYELTLNPANPMQYLYDGAFRDIEQVPVTIQVKEDDGSLSEETRTLYRSHYGPMFTLSVEGVPVLGWSPLKAYTLRDANAENNRLINQFAKWNQAQSLDEFIALHKSVLGIPWVNTVASGPGGQAYYGDVSVVPNVPDSKVTTCQAIPMHQTLQLLVPGLPVLDGSRAACEWDTDADAPVPGIFGGSNLPTLLRDDWVHNSNDSYWLTNPAEPLTGYAAIIGDEDTERSLRTRLGILQIQRRLDGSDGRPGDRFDVDTLQDVVLSSQVYSAQLERDTVLGSICALGTVLTTSGPVDVSDACNVLANWDLSGNTDAVGAHIWREFWRNTIAGLGLPVGNDLLLWTTPYSSGDPVNTPRGLNVLDPLVQAALGDAVTAIEAAGYALDQPMGQIQHPGYIDPTIPVFGGEGFEGAFTIASSGPISTDGYPIDFGNSYIQTVTWNDGKVEAEGFVTYSESTDPANPHFSDYTREYSAKRWHRFPFTDAEIEADRISRQHLSE